MNSSTRFTLRKNDPARSVRTVHCSCSESSSRLRRSESRRAGLPAQHEHCSSSGLSASLTLGRRREQHRGFDMSGRLHSTKLEVCEQRTLLPASLEGQRPLRRPWVSVWREAKDAADLAVLLHFAGCSNGYFSAVLLRTFWRQSHICTRQYSALHLETLNRSFPYGLQSRA